MSTNPDQHIAYVSFDVLTIHYTLKSVKFCSTEILLPILTVQESDLKAALVQSIYDLLQVARSKKSLPVKLWQ